MAMLGTTVRLLARGSVWGPSSGLKAASRRLLCPVSRPFSSTPTRLSDPEGWVYRGIRQGHYEAKIHDKMAIVVSAIVWAWLTYNSLVNYEMVLGHHAYPDRKAMTNAQLGVPEDE
ncbi:hypothetical protein TCAL_16971 [Tigriopus californicus]|uniref:Uncharacterized protein n=1 Tax=Tigriopus californicus TaxID=6832 RepID=A0A553PG77_TIGCA|nr:uncharacterized protein LOC131880803 [Tigriopus californicus]TRY76674.1 hypothetical protein TCAL_16971 [Tigriopus californicus]